MILRYSIKKILAKGGQEYLDELRALAKLEDDQWLWIDQSSESFRKAWAARNPRAVMPKVDGDPCCGGKADEPAFGVTE